MHAFLAIDDLFTSSSPNSPTNAESIIHHLNASTVCPSNITTVQSCFSDLKNHVKIDVIHEQLYSVLYNNEFFSYRYSFTSIFASV